MLRKHSISKIFFSILVTKYFSILKHFSQFWNSFLDSKIYYSILKFFLDSVILFWFFFFFDSIIFFLDFIISFFSFFESEIFFEFQIFFSILKVFSQWVLSATIMYNYQEKLWSFSWRKKCSLKLNYVT